MSKKAAARTSKSKTASAQVSAPEQEAIARKYRNRNVGIRQVRAGDLIPHPKNWRKHPTAQVNALRGVLAEVGYVGVLLAREIPTGLQLIDGHLRADTLEDDIVDVMVVDLDDREVEVILATHDPLGDAAELDSTSFNKLIMDLTIADGALSELLSHVADSLGRPEREHNGAVPQKTAAERQDCEYPIAPVFNEKYDYVVIMTTNETDWGAIQTILELERVKSYKTTGVGIGRVITFEKFFNLWNKWMDQGEAGSAKQQLQSAKG